MGVFADAFFGSRFLVVVRRGNETTYEYLRTRLAGVRGVEITLDRRANGLPEVPTDRRREPPPFNAFGVLLVRR